MEPTSKSKDALQVAAVLTFAVTASIVPRLLSQDRPFTRTELLQHLRTHMPDWAHETYNVKCREVAELVRQRGISFPYDPWRFDEELHKAGACTAVKVAMSENIRIATAPTPLDAGQMPPPSAAVRATPPAPAPNTSEGQWRVGDQVEAWITAEWLPATILRIGGGPFPEDPYLVQYGKPIRGNYANRWLNSDDIRRPKAGSVVTAQAPVPRLGSYTILSYGNPTSPPVRLGRIDLIAGGLYRRHDAGGRVLGEGQYAFDAAAGAVQWLSGPLKDQGWSGTFTVEREGKTHKIRLMRTTIATNSTD